MLCFIYEWRDSRKKYYKWNNCEKFNDNKNQMILPKIYYHYN